MSTDYESEYNALLIAIADSPDEKWVIEMLASFSAPSLDDNVKELLKQDENKIKSLINEIGGSIFDYKNEVSVLTGEQTEEEDNVSSTEYSSDVTSGNNTGY